MTITPTGPISVPQHKLRELVARLPAFVRALEAANISGPAIDRVYLAAPVLLDPDRARPFATVALPDESFELQLVAAGAQHVFRPAGTLWLGLAADAAMSDPYGNDSWTAFTNWVGEIISDLESLAGADDELPSVQLRWAMPPRITRPESGFDRPFHLCLIEVRYQ